MYCMSVTKFDADDLMTTFHEAYLEDKKLTENIKNNIMQHHFNSKVMVHLPNENSLPDSIDNVLREDKSFYCIKNLPVQNLCEDEFIKAFVKCGRMYAYTADTRLDIDNCAAFTPSGSLYLLLNQNTYHELGISGKLSTHILRFPKHRYFVEINTSEKSFIPGHKIYERTHRSLDSCSLVFDFFITWHPNDKSICPSSIAKFFHDRGFEIEEIFPFYKQSLCKKNLKIPKLSDLPKNFDYQNLLEWFGMCAADIDSDLINEIAVEEISNLSPLNVSHWEGFYTPSDIEEIIQELREWLHTQDSETVPWVCLTVYGPTDCLISWSRTTNAFKINGENFYLLIIFRNKLMYYTIEESRKPQRMYVKSSNNK